jgi:hypothetical protein
MPRHKAASRQLTSMLFIRFTSIFRNPISPTCARLAETRLPDKETVADNSQGVPLKTV